MAKCLRIEYAKDNITFHIMHPPLTQTKSASPLPVPNEFKASPEKVGYGLAKHINSKRYIICHSFNQKIQTMGCYVFPIKWVLYFQNDSQCREVNNRIMLIKSMKRINSAGAESAPTFTIWGRKAPHI